MTNSSKSAFSMGTAFTVLLLGAQGQVLLASGAPDLAFAGAVVDTHQQDLGKTAARLAAKGAEPLSSKIEIINADGKPVKIAAALTAYRKFVRSM